MGPSPTILPPPIPVYSLSITSVDKRGGYKKKKVLGKRRKRKKERGGEKKKELNERKKEEGKRGEGEKKRKEKKIPRKLYHKGPPSFPDSFIQLLGRANMKRVGYRKYEYVCVRA